LRGFLPQDKEVPTRRAKKARKEVLTQDWGKKTAKQFTFLAEISISQFQKSQLFNHCIK